MHDDFVKILGDFEKVFGDAEGRRRFDAWVTSLGLKTDLAYDPRAQFEAADPARLRALREGIADGLRVVEEKAGPKCAFMRGLYAGLGEKLDRLPPESFKWAEPLISFLKEEGGRRLYRVIAAASITSMNGNKYTADELETATKMLVTGFNNLNHTGAPFPVRVEAAKFDGGALSELVVSVDPGDVVPKHPDAGDAAGVNVAAMLDHSPSIPERLHVYHVSIEAGCTLGVEPKPDGLQCNGLIITGLGWLTKFNLPGIPITMVDPVESKPPAEKPKESAPAPRRLDEEIDGIAKRLAELEARLGAFEKRLPPAAPEPKPEAKPAEETHTPSEKPSTSSVSSVETAPAEKAKPKTLAERAKEIAAERGVVEAEAYRLALHEALAST